MNERDESRRSKQPTSNETNSDSEPVRGKPSRRRNSNTDDTAESNAREQTEKSSTEIVGVAKGVPHLGESLTVDNRVEPATHSKQHHPTVAVVHGKVTVLEQSLSSTIRPPVKSSIEGQTADHSIPSSNRSIGIGSFEIEAKTGVSEPLVLDRTASEQEEFVNTLAQKEIQVENRAIKSKIQPSTMNTQQRPELTPEEYDPCYEWSGGTPYGTTTPQCIVHIAPAEYESLQFLQRVLRDVYAELEGGRPRTEVVRPHGGSVSVPSIQGSIITLDLTTDQWSVGFDGGEVSIAHEGRDSLQELRSTVESLYGGQLGYFILNISEEDLNSRFHSGLRERFVDSLLKDSERGVDSIDSSGMLSEAAAPIRVARPRYTQRATFESKVGQYFGFESAPEQRVADVEATQEKCVRVNDWRRVALTERQEQGEGESDEHYLWKASLVEGLAWHMKERYKQTESEISFDSFVESQLLPTGPIRTEAEFSQSGAFADLHVLTQEQWAWAGVRGFLDDTSIEPSQQTDVVIEYETGRSEGAFNFRKLRETLEKYESESNIKICVVVPPRVLFRSKARARMLARLVESGQEGDGTRRATLCVPKLNETGCTGLRSAEALVDDWFGEAE